MVIRPLTIETIPALLWGEPSSRLIVAVHGNMSDKQDVPIGILAEEAFLRGYQVLSFDLPQHGDRKTEPTLCKVQTCVAELEKVMDFAAQQAEHISLFACSMGAYFSLLAYKQCPIQQSLFLSPVVDMARIIENMMSWFQISAAELKAKQEIPTPIGQTLYWDYYSYVKANPIEHWQSPTSILYGKEDTLCERTVLDSFVKKFGCNLEVMEAGEHHFHTPEQLEGFRLWVRDRFGRRRL